VDASKLHPAIRDIWRLFDQSDDRYAAHGQACRLLQDLASDRPFVYDAMRRQLADPKFLQFNRSLYFPIFEWGDVMLAINLFVPIRDRAPAISYDNIHHHGWRLLTSVVLSGDGYEAMSFVRHSHESRTGRTVHLQIADEIKHAEGRARFIDSHTCHVIFHPVSLCSTFALWSADRVLLNQEVKKHTHGFPKLAAGMVRVAHAARLDKLLGLNAIRGRYYHPEGGRIVETLDYPHRPVASRAEATACLFRFLQQVGFYDIDFLRRAATNAPPDFAHWTNMLAAGDPIPDNGLWGDPRRRFSKVQIVQAIENSSPQALASSFLPDTEIELGTSVYGVSPN
jgi:hypothetical protein